MNNKKIQRKEMQKNSNSGITLIALVVSIIVLLILAGISIQMLTGDNGVLQKATDAKTKSDKSQIIERIQLAYHSALTGGQGSYTKESLENELEKEFGEDFEEVDDSNNTNWILKAKGQSITIPAGSIIAKDLVPGLYETNSDTLKISWEKLLQDGILEDNNGTLTRTGTTPSQLDGRLVIANNITNIYSLYGCNLLTGIEIQREISFDSNNTFTGCSNITTIVLGSSNITAGMKKVENYAWTQNVSTVILKDSITSIGEGAFAGRSTIKNVTMSKNITSIGEQAFAGCVGITSITIPEKVTTIGEFAFANCTSISNITIPEKVNSIAANSFSQWTSSQTINVLGYASKPAGYADGWNGNANVVWKTE